VTPHSGHDLILATRNRGKVGELITLLAGIDVQVHSLLERSDISEVVEDGETFEQNAVKKAVEIFRQTGMPALADDSGLEVDALGLQPGVYSARYAGEHVSYEENNRKLLAELSGVPEGERIARFRCVVAFVGDGYRKVTEGICPGRIGLSLRGTNGFGYDPLFVPAGYSQTFAELPLEIKNTISHRGLALRRMIPHLREYFSAL